MVSVSKMSGKLQGIPAINTNTATNPFCIERYSKGDPDDICTFCYSHKMLNTYRKSCQPSFQRNSDILASDTGIDIPKINASIVRFNGHGELLNDTHFRNLCAIASNYPRTNFALWTKRVDIVRSNLYCVPKNMILVYSNPKIDRVLTKPPRGFHRVFSNVTDKYTGDANCTGQKCIDCQLCYHFDTTQVIVEHVK
jgi:hypothetical protein